MLISQRTLLLNQVQTIPCGHFVCQVRNLFLNRAAFNINHIKYTNNHIRGVKFIHQYHLGSLTRAQATTTTLSNALHLTHSKRNYSRFSANTILTGTAMMKLTDYDCIGFDLDNVRIKPLNEH